MPYEENHLQGLIEIQCKKCESRITVDADTDLIKYVCVFCETLSKNSINFITRCGKHPHDPYIGSGSCKYCAEEFKMWRAVKAGSNKPQQESIVSKGHFTNRIQKRREAEKKRLDAESALIEMPRLIKKLINQLEKKN